MQSRNKLSRLILSLIFLAAVLVAWANHQSIYDWIRLRGYEPPIKVAQLASDDTMTSYARHMFYINHPQIEGQATFNQDCPDDGGEQTIVLGCYSGNQTGIFLYSINDPKLAGVEQVTAAHEMLHASYDRLSQKEKEHINQLLQEFYLHNLNDKRVKATIESYKKSEPNDVVNEMHSVFGTEVPKLTPELEAYYNKYFLNRSKVVAYAQKYQSTFTNNKALADKYAAQIKDIEQQLAIMKQQIDNSETALRNENLQLESDRASLNSSNVNSFNNRVDQYNAKVQTYRTLISNYNDLIETHNNLVIKYRAITVETNQLIQELDSRSAKVNAQ